MTENQKAIERILKIMNELREQCPWDKKQTIETLRSLTLEEVYELTESIQLNDWDGIKKELGDVLLHLIFYSKIAKEQGHFDFKDVINQLCEKLIFRHPHIYGDVKVENEEDVKRNWEQLKLKEGNDSILSGVPKGLPSIIKATRIQEKAKQVGFEWANSAQVLAKIEEEIAELKEVIATNNRIEMENELGDVLFSIINYARFIKIDADAALERTNQKFITRFTKMEKIATDNGNNLANLTLTQMDDIWNNIKKDEK
jgi:MazG family protein